MNTLQSSDHKLVTSFASILFAWRVTYGYDHATEEVFDWDLELVDSCWDVEDDYTEAYTLTADSAFSPLFGDPTNDTLLPDTPPEGARPPGWMVRELTASAREEAMGVTVDHIRTTWEATR